MLLPKSSTFFFNFSDVIMVVKHVACVWNFTYLCYKDCSTRISHQNNRLFIRKLNMVSFITKNTKKLSTKNFCWWIPYWKKIFISQIWCTSVHKLREPSKNVKEKLLNSREMPQNGEFVDNNLFISPSSDSNEFDFYSNKIYMFFMVFGSLITNSFTKLQS